MASMGPWDSAVNVCIAKHLTKQFVVWVIFHHPWSLQVFVLVQVFFFCAAQANSIVVSSLIHPFQVVEMIQPARER